MCITMYLWDNNSYHILSIHHIQNHFYLLQEAFSFLGYNIGMNAKKYGLMREKDKYQMFTQYYPLCTLQNSDSQDLNLDTPASIAWALCVMLMPPSNISPSPNRPSPHSSLLITDSCFFSAIRWPCASGEFVSCPDQRLNQIW